MPRGMPKNRQRQNGNTNRRGFPREQVPPLIPLIPSSAAEEVEITASLRQGRQIVLMASADNEH
jgi:hypothetical protein